MFLRSLQANTQKTAIQKIIFGVLGNVSTKIYTVVRALSRKHYIFTPEYIDNDSRSQLMKETGLSSIQITNWFKMRKIKEKPRNARLIQSDQLQKTFQITQYPDKVRRLELENETGLTSKQIDMWFKNNRYKHKSKKIKSELDSDAALSDSKDQSNKATPGLRNDRRKKFSSSQYAALEKAFERYSTAGFFCLFITLRKIQI